jgi:hypothetical protein
MINAIVDNCHVSLSYLAVIRYFFTRINKRKYYALSKSQRRKILKQIVARHEDNKKIYTYVMRGGF